MSYDASVDVSAQKQHNAADGWFATTHWSVVLTAKDRFAPGAPEALEKLCRAYWKPIYVFITRQGYLMAEAKDLTQEFFLRLIERDYLRHLRHQNGRFRSFILTVLKHFLQEQRGRSQAQKRGGEMVFVPLDGMVEEDRDLHEPAGYYSPDQLFERRWAQSLFEATVEQLREEYVANGKEALFDVLKDFQPREPGAPTYAQIGSGFGLTEAAVKSAVQRMRQRHREILREQIAHTVARPDEIEEEIRYLRSLLSTPGP
jgi:RNA polymerase sigma factor (sigma-70 family)